VASDTRCRESSCLSLRMDAAELWTPKQYARPAAHALALTQRGFRVGAWLHCLGGPLDAYAAAAEQSLTAGKDLFSLDDAAMARQLGMSALAHRKRLWVERAKLALVKESQIPPPPVTGAAVERRASVTTAASSPGALGNFAAVRAQRMHGRPGASALLPPAFDGYNGVHARCVVVSGALA
jgi:hypothetical protein